MARTYNTLPYVRHGRRNGRHWTTRYSTWWKRKLSKAERKLAKQELAGNPTRERGVIRLRSEVNWKCS